jgi:hypothetical protein
MPNLLAYLIWFIRIISHCHGSVCDEIDEMRQTCLIKNMNHLKAIEFDRNTVELSMIIIYPETRFVLNGSLRIFSDPDHSISLLRLSNFAGVDVTENIFIDNVTFFVSKSIQFFNSDFIFYSNIHESTNNSKPKFFSKPLYELVYKSDIRYFENISEWQFENAQLPVLEINSMTNTSLNRNFFTFWINSSINSSEFNCKVSSLTLSVYKVQINDRILSKNVFHNLEELYLNDFVRDIEKETFKSLRNLKMIRFSVFSLKILFQQSTEWMRYLNYYVKVDYKNQSNISQSHSLLVRFHETFLDRLGGNIYNYDYPNEDICQFKNFPFENYVLPVTDYCKPTCTYAWLVQFSDYFENNPKNFLCPTRICDFANILAVCKKLISASVDYNDDFYKLFDRNYHFKRIDFILSIIVFPLVCLLGILFNLINILVLSNKNFLKDFKQKMYTQMRLNSFGNLLICSIFLSKLLFKCIDPVNSYCISSRLVSRINRYFLLLLVNYFGNVLITVSNTINIFISLDRLLRSIILKSSIKRLRKLPFNNFLVISFAFSLVINFIRIFEYNKDTSYSNLTFPMIFEYFFDFRLFYAYFNIFNILVCNFLLLFVQLFIDIFLLIHIKVSLKKKIKILDLTHEKHSDTNENYINKKVKSEKTVRNVKIMIALNGICLFLFHLPDLVLTILMSTIYGHNQGLYSPETFEEGLIYLYTYVLKGLSDVCYFLSFSFYFFLFISFNHHFRNSFLNLLFGKKPKLK